MVEVILNQKIIAYKPRFPCLRRSVGVPGSHLPGVMISTLEKCNLNYKKLSHGK